MDNKKNVLWSTIGIACNVFISLFFLIIVARVNTEKDLAIFSFTFALANTMYVLGSFGGRVYQVTDSKNEFHDNDYIGFRVLSALSMMILAVLFVLANGYDLYKSGIMILLVGFKFVESISDVYFGIMQKNEKLYCVGKSMTSKALFGIMAFLVVDLVTKNLFLSICSVIIINLIIFIVYDLNIVRKIKKVYPTFKSEMLLKMIRTCSYFFTFTFLSSLVINFPRYGIDLFSTVKIQGIYAIIIMPATSIALFGQFIVQPMLVNLANAHGKGDIKGFSKIINKAILLLIGFTAVAEVGAYIIGIPVLSLVYGIDLTDYKGALLIVLLGALFSTIAAVLSVALTTMRSTGEQLILYVCNTIFAAIISMILVSKFGLMGGVLSYVFIMLFQVSCYLVLYRFKIKKEGMVNKYE